MLILKVIVSKLISIKKHVKNSVGFIPNLTSNQKNKSGFIVSASVNRKIIMHGMFLILGKVIGVFNL